MNGLCSLAAQSHARLQGCSHAASAVLQIDPMNTIVRKDDGVPVIVPNSVAADCLVANVSRSKAPKAV